MSPSLFHGLPRGVRSLDAAGENFRHPTFARAVHQHDLVRAAISLCRNIVAGLPNIVCGSVFHPSSMAPFTEPL